jgi:hypothetical protein
MFKRTNEPKEKEKTYADGKKNDWKRALSLCRK